MAKRKHPKKKKTTFYRLRYHAPRIVRRGKRTIISCPFCANPHPISPEPSPCGTYLEVRAVQPTFKNETCALCGERTGVLVQVGNLFVHAEPCTEDKRVFAVPPRNSVWAGIAYWLSYRLKIKSFFGRVPLRLYRNGKPAGFTWVTNAEA